MLGIADHRTLDRLIAENFPDTPTWDEAFERYAAEGRASLRRKQFEMAVDNGSIPMLIFLGKNYLGQSDTGVKEQDQPKQGTGKLTTLKASSKFTARAVNG